MNFVNKELFKIAFFKQGKLPKNAPKTQHQDIFVLDTVFTEHHKDRKLKEEHPITLLVDKYYTNIKGFKQTDHYKEGEANEWMYTKDACYHEDKDSFTIDYRNVSAAGQDEPETWVIGIPIMRAINKISVGSAIAVKKAVLSKSPIINGDFSTKPKVCFHGPNTEDNPETTHYDKILVLICQVAKTGSRDIAIEEVSLGVAASKKIMENADPKKKVKIATKTIKFAIPNKEGEELNVYPDEFKLEKVLMSHERALKVAKRIVDKVKITDLIRPLPQPKSE